MRWLIALKRKDTSGLSSPGYSVKTATGRIGDKQNGDTPKRRQTDRLTVQSTIGHRECNDHAEIPFCLIATYFYRIIRHFCIRLSLIVLCHSFITDTIECQNTAIILCMYTNHNNAHHCYHTHILTRLLYKS